MNSLQFSFELIPSNHDQETIKMIETARKLEVFKPTLYTLANSIRGTATKQTFDATKAINQLDISLVAPYVSCQNATKQSITDLLTRYKEEGVYNLVVLQGLPHEENTLIDFKYANELITFIKEQFGSFFTLYSSAYPETHFQAVSAEEDLQATIRKLQSGASGAISQFFYNIESFLFMRDQLIKKGCFATIIPSIMPIHSYETLFEYANQRHVEVPRWLNQNLMSRQHNQKAFDDFSLEVMITLCERLIKEGVKHFHFHTLNDPTQVSRIINVLLNQ